MIRAYAFAFSNFLTGLKRVRAAKSFLFKVSSLVGALAFGLAACTPTVNEQTPAPQSPPPAPFDGGKGPVDLQPLQIYDFLAREESGQTILTLKLSKPISQYRHFPLVQPARIVLDIFGNAVVPPDLTSFRIGTNLVGTVRFTAGEDSLRMTMDVVSSSAPVYSISADAVGLRIVIGSPDPKTIVVRDLALVRAGKRVDSVAAQAISASCSEGRAVTSEITEPVKTEKKYVGDKITLDFKDADIRNIFRILGELRKKNIIVTDEVNKKVTLRLIEVPSDQALDLVIETNGLAKEEFGDVIRISTAPRIARERRELQDARKAGQSAEIPQLSYLNVNYAKVKDVAEKVKQLIKTGAEIVSDDRSNTLIVRGTKNDVDEILCIVAKLDVRTPQVLIESNLIETTPTFARALGVRLQFVSGGTTFSNAAGAGGGNSPFTASTPLFPALPTGLGGTISVIQNKLGGLRNLTAALEAAENEGNVRVISRPSVVTLNNVASTIRSERILRISLPSSTNIATGSGSSAAGAAVATERISVGIILTVTPQVSSDGFVLLNINVKSSSIAPNATVGGGTAGVIPFDELNREATANVLVKDGETIVLGGILKDSGSTSESGLPYLKDIPVFGWLFKSVRQQKDFEELMVFITPRITNAGVSNLPSAEQLWRDQMRTTYGDKQGATGINP